MAGKPGSITARSAATRNAEKPRAQSPPATWRRFWCLRLMNTSASHMRTEFDHPAPLLPANPVFPAALAARFRADARVRPAKRARRLAAGQRHAAAADNAVTPRLRAIGPRMHWLECSQGSVPRQTAPLPGVQTPGPSMVRKQTHCSAPGLQPTTPILQPPTHSSFRQNPVGQQSPPHGSLPLGQQLPFVQPPLPHPLPHVPQFFGSVCRSPHSPAQHVVPPPHPFPHVPQLVGSLLRSLHSVPHSVRPASAGAAGPHVKQRPFPWAAALRQSPRRRPAGRFWQNSAQASTPWARVARVATATGRTATRLPSTRRREGLLPRALATALKAQS